MTQIQHILDAAGVTNPAAVAATIHTTLTNGGNQAAVEANLATAGLAPADATRIGGVIMAQWNARGNGNSGNSGSGNSGNQRPQLPASLAPGQAQIQFGPQNVQMPNFVLGTAGQQAGNSNGANSGNNNGNAQPQHGNTQVVNNTSKSSGFPAWATVLISVACALGIVALIMFAFGYFANANGIESNKAKVAQVESESKAAVAAAKAELEAKVVNAAMDRMTMKHAEALRNLQVDHVLGSHKAAIEDNRRDIDDLGAVAAAHDDTLDNLLFDGRIRDFKIGNIEQRVDAQDASIARARASAGGWRNRVQQLEGRADATDDRLNQPLTIRHGR